MNDENIHIGLLLKQCFSYWKIYVPVGIACLIAAVCFILITPKEYEFTARIQLIQDHQGIVSEMKMLKSSGIGALLGGKSSGLNADDEMIVLQSRHAMRAAILQTGYQIETRQRRGLKKVLLYGTDNPFNVLFPEQLLDTLSEPLKITLTLSEGMIRAATVKSKLFRRVKLSNLPLPCRIELPTGAFAVTSGSNKEVLVGEHTFEITVTPLQTLYEALLKKLVVKPEVTMSDIILLKIDNESKQRGCDFLNTLINAYNHYSRGVKVKEAGLNARFVKERLDTITTELAYLEYQIETYKRMNSIPEVSLYAKSAMTGSQQLEKTILETEAHLKMLDYVLAYLQSPENEYASVPVVDGVGEKTILLYNQLILDRQRLLLSSEHNNPALMLLNNQLAEQRKMLVETITAFRKSIRAGLEAIHKKNHTLNTQLDALPTQEREYIEMTRQQKIKETIYLFLMQKLQEKELINSPDEQAARVVDAAYSSAKAVYPVKLIVLAIALIAACMISLALCYVKYSSGQTK
ncbi:MAG: hypothetical protein LBN06_07235 [Prevotellaceae bacterium]|jgi:uncharacterized protein involved in exopolysaccharide biosynthesis|nr:hypothetical protein [Prevotellaceae bacterium]